MILSDVGKLMAKCCDKRDMCLIKNQGFDYVDKKIIVSELVLQ
jgi:hypothetical protein